MASDKLRVSKYLMYILIWIVALQNIFMFPLSVWLYFSILFFSTLASPTLLTYLSVYLSLLKPFFFLFQENTGSLRIPKVSHLKIVHIYLCPAIANPPP